MGLINKDKTVKLKFTSLLNQDLLTLQKSVRSILLDRSNTYSLLTKLSYIEEIITYSKSKPNILGDYSLYYKDTLVFENINLTGKKEFELSALYSYLSLNKRFFKDEKEYKQVVNKAFIYYYTHIANLHLIDEEKYINLINFLKENPTEIEIINFSLI